MRKTLKAGAAVAAALAISLGAAACGSEHQDSGHARAIDKSAPDAIAFSDTFSNVEDKCDHHGHRVFVSTHDGIAVIADPSC